MNTTIEFFDEHASLYDAYQQACVPRYHEAMSVATGWLDRFIAKEHETRFLDVGCGTGNTTAEILKLFPGAHVSCVDGSTEMISRAQNKFQGRNVGFHAQEIGREGWNRQWIGNPFDAAISLFVLEHLPFDTYRQVLSDLFEVLKPGAWFVAAEGYAGERCLEIYFEEMALWEEKALSKGVVTKEQLDRAKALSAEKEVHYFSPVDDKKKWWTEAGFTEVGVIWFYYCIGVMVGRKPS